MLNQVTLVVYMSAKTQKKKSLVSLIGILIEPSETLSFVK